MNLLNRYQSINCLVAIHFTSIDNLKSYLLSWFDDSNFDVESATLKNNNDMLKLNFMHQHTFIIERTDHIILRLNEFDIMIDLKCEIFEYRKHNKNDKKLFICSGKYRIKFYNFVSSNLYI